MLAVLLLASSGFGSLTAASVAAQSIRLPSQTASASTAIRRDKAHLLLAQAVSLARAEEHPIGKALGFIEIASVYARLGNKERATELLTEADRIMLPIKSLPDGLSKNLVLVPMAVTYIEAGKNDRAEEILDGIIQQYEALATDKDPEWQGRAADNEAGWLVQLGPLYLVMGKEQKALMLIARNHERLKKVDHWLYRDRGLEQTALAYAALGKREVADEIMKTVKPGREQNEGLSKIAIAYGQAGDLDKALAITRTIKDGAIERLNLLWLVKKFFDVGRTDLARELVGESEASFLRQKQVLKTLARQGDLALGWVMVGEYEKALRESEQEMPDRQQVETLTQLSYFFFKAGRTSDANHLLQRAAKRTTSSKGSNFEARELSEVGRAYCAIDQKEFCASFLARAVNVLKSISGDQTNDYILSEISETYAFFEMDDHALATADLISDKYERARTLAGVARIQLGIPSDRDPRLEPFGPFGRQ